MTEEEAGFTILEHTADVGLRAWGTTPGAAFSMAAFGMFEVILDVDPRVWLAEGRHRVLEVEAEGSVWDDLLVNWLAELVYLFDVEGFVPRSISFTRCEPGGCAAQLSGLVMTDPGDTAGTAIKAVTYHQLRVDVGPERTELQVIFDI